VRPVVDPNSKAAFLARKLTESQRDIVSAVAIDSQTLDLHVQPENLGAWDWWQERLRIPAGTATYLGSDAKATGAFGSVKVLLTGHGVGTLFAAEFRNNGGAR
jgi:hypothetical protein